MSEKDWIPLEEPPYDEPPYEEPPFAEPPYEESPHDNEAPYTRGHNRQREKHSNANFNGAKNLTRETLEELGARVLDTMRSVISSVHMTGTDSAKSVIDRIMTSERALDCISEKDQHTYVGVFEVLNHECNVTESGVLDLHHLPVALEYSTPVRVELSMIEQKIGRESGEPHARWQAIVEAVQRHHTRAAALRLAASIDAKDSVGVMMGHFKGVEPPTTQKSVTRKHAARTARVIMNEHKASLAGKKPMRFSSGMPTLDKGYTGTGQLPGLIAPGELIMIMGPTGTGKSSFCYGITPAMTQDLRNYGLPNAKHVLFHTEEESTDKIEACRMGPGQPYGHLADMLVVDAIGTSRQRMAETLYDLVIEADTRAREMKLPITDFLPYIVQLDYLQSITEQGEDEKTATGNTSEFLLRGVCAWNPDEMAKFSGVNFREYAGMGWPEGMESHRVAVMAYAQLIKIDSDSERFREGKSKASDFALMNAQDDTCWDVKEGDLRLFSKGQMRGSGVVANNAHAIIILHRSVPSPNPVDPTQTEASGIEHLTDNRARILFDKSRNGTKLLYAPMVFDRQVDGPKAQYFDELAENAIVAGLLKSYDKNFYTGRGSMILPLRPVVNPLEAYKY